jgi:hypothetical protein
MQGKREEMRGRDGKKRSRKKSDAHFKHIRLPYAAAASHVVLSHSHPFSRAYLLTFKFTFSKKVQKNKDVGEGRGRKERK